MEAGGIFLRFLVLCTLAVGGLNTVMPGMFHYVVEEQGWISAHVFADLYALGQASPGPNALWVTLIGLQIASWPGALAATAAVLLPGTVFSLAMVTLQSRDPHGPFATAFRRGLAPVAMGLMFASVWVLIRAIGHDVVGLGMTLLAAAAVLRTRLSPYILLGMGALAGMAGLV